MVPGYARDRDCEGLDGRLELLMRIETDMDVLLYTSRRGTAITVKPNGTNGICCNVSHGRHPCSMIVGFVELIADRCKVRSSAAHAPALRSLLDLSCPERQSLDSFCAERSDPSRSPG